MLPLRTAEEIQLREVLPSPPPTTTQLTRCLPSALSVPSRGLDHQQREQGRHGRGD